MEKGGDGGAGSGALYPRDAVEETQRLTTTPGPVTVQHQAGSRERTTSKMPTLRTVRGNNWPNCNCHEVCIKPVEITITKQRG